jgi:hypothetical protein
MVELKLLFVLSNHHESYYAAVKESQKSFSLIKVISLFFNFFASWGQKQGNKKCRICLVWPLLIKKIQSGP